ncbi:EAL domain-containing protein [Thermomonas sp.]|uniref:EAL domain-containing protein n=1 Tax=Thermomonas sp. TaxID=1971895 RepID=UPI002636EBF0|nr:EAL domain-containing protein [Thermomonas sp.]
MARNCSRPPASASPWANHATARPRNCCATPTSPCTGPRPTGGSASSCSTSACTGKRCSCSTWESDLRHAIQRREFEPHFQPIVDLRDCRIVGFESLLRWRHPQRGLLLPGDFRRWPRTMAASSRSTG